MSMKAWAIHKAGGPEVLEHVEIPKPTLSLPRDILVKVKAVALNPVDYKIRKNFSGSPSPHVLGWDASGVVEAVGSEVLHYKVGDEVYFAGSITREGCFSEYCLVDERIVGRKPKNLSWEQAAAEPLTVLTAWEGMVERMAIPVPPAGTVYKNPKTLLVIAGAGGVGTCAIQLGKHVLGLRVVATANREETIKFCKELGADYTIKHGEPLLPQLKALGIDGVDYVMHCWEAHTLWDELPAVVNPLGKISFITTGEELKIKPFMSKGIAVCPELMFTRPIYGFDLDAQRTILDSAAELLEKKIWKPRMTQAFEWNQLLEAHKLVESGKAIGKVSVRLP